ncbi:hypothetical protein Dsin_029217 [Dipteronia sinensis]|uniref:Uncharacterized protein n=1 Tax=Dipteronia sinensis TaxID=43782 RepID=A0AAE0DV98_9ROSI|nr:hypothetical protein Dsin_029217 [Dipteronia sinensis]
MVRWPCKWIGRELKGFDIGLHQAVYGKYPTDQLSNTLRQKGPITYASLVDDVGGYAMAEDEQIAHGQPSESQKPKDNGSKGNPKGNDDQQNDPTKPDQNRTGSPRGSSDAGAINTIFGGPYTRRSYRERMSEAHEAIDGQRNFKVNSMGSDQKKLKQGWDPIIFSEVDAYRLEVKPNDTIIMTARIRHREVRRILIDNGSSADILSARVFD